MTWALFFAYSIKLIHLLVCIALIVIVLFQADKGEGLAGAFGGGASATIFGERGGETQISRMTTLIAVVFMFTSLIIAVWGPGWDKEIRDSKYTVNNYNPNAQPTTPVPGMPGMPGMPGVPGANPMVPAFPMGTTMPMGSTVTTTPAQTTAPAVETTPAPAQTTAPAVETTPAPAQTVAPAVEATPAPAQTVAPIVETTPAPIQTIQAEPNANPMVVPAAPLPEEKPSAPTKPQTVIPGVSEQ